MRKEPPEEFIVGSSANFSPLQKQIYLEDIPSDVLMMSTVVSKQANC